MTVVSCSYACTVSSKASIDAFLLQVVALLYTDSKIPIGGSGIANAPPLLTCTVTNRLSQRTGSLSATGLVGSIRLLYKTSSCSILIGSSEQAQIESWVQSTDQTLLSIVRKGKTDELFAKSVKDLMQSIDSHLQYQTYLVGGFASVADIVTAIGLAAACEQLGITQISFNVYRWLTTTLAQVKGLVQYYNIEHWQSFGLDECGCLSRWIEAFVASSETIYKTKAPAVVAAVTPTPAQSESAETKIEEKAGKPKEESAPTLAPEPISENKKEKEILSASATEKATESPTAPSSTSNGDSNNVILQKLDEFGINFERYDHKLSKTAEELVGNVPLPVNETHTKNLFFRDKKHGLFLVSVQTDSNVVTKDLGKTLGLAGKTNLRLADEATLQRVLQVKPGCVGPLAVVLAPSDETVTLVLDQKLLSFDMIHSHPLHNDQSVKMAPTDFLAYFEKAGITPTLVEFADGKAATDMFAGKVPADRPPASGDEKALVEKKSDKPKSVNKDKKTVKKGETLLALKWKKTENFAMWYTDVIVLSEMISYYDISGCYILRPWSYKMWELIQDWFNGKIIEMGVENAYFPLFVSQDRLEREKDHVEGFAPEVAWVTKSGSGDLAKPIAVRPTSETIMYPAYSDWIKSHRDLPLKLNQWSNVVRWEFKYPTPFLRTREFLWQEGHTAHTTFDDADTMVMDVLDLYRGVYEELLAVPVIKGYKTEKEKFAGGFRTTTVEAYIAGSGRAIQGATSHNLGQNFGKMFDIKFQDEKGGSQIAWQTSWGLTTRTIGVMVMVHGDDVGLVLPPRIAPLQVVIVPIVSKKLNVEDADPYCLSIFTSLKKAGIRAKYDNRTIYNPGWKYNHWEQKGVPLRIEVGPRDIEQKSVRVVIRHNGEKEDISIDGLDDVMKNKLDEIQNAMFNKAKEARDSHIVQITEWKDFVPNLEKNNMVLTPWCGGEHQDWEEKVKEMSREESLKARGEEVEDEKTSTSVAAKTLCIPFEQPELPPGTKCIASDMDATCWVLWGRSY